MIILITLLRESGYAYTKRLDTQQMEGFLSTSHVLILILVTALLKQVVFNKIS